MAFDAHANLAIATVLTAPSPATSGTSVIVASGDGARFPAAPFNATVWPAAQPPTPVNAEVVRVTARTADTLTIARAQEGTTARAIVAGDLVAATITVKTLADLESGRNFPEIIVGQAGRVAGAAFIDLNYFANGLVAVGVTTTAASNVAIFYTPSGIAGYIQTVGTTTAYGTTSDARLKQDLGVVKTDQGHDVLRDTVIHDFTWTADGRPGRGVFAQEAVAVAPGAVLVGADGVDAEGHLLQPWAVDYGKYVPDLIVGWQAHDAQITALTAQVAALEARLAALEG